MFKRHFHLHFSPDVTFNPCWLTDAAEMQNIALTVELELWDSISKCRTISGRKTLSHQACVQKKTSCCGPKWYMIFASWGTDPVSPGGECNLLLLAPSLGRLDYNCLMLPVALQTLNLSKKSLKSSAMRLLQETYKVREFNLNHLVASEVTILLSCALFFTFTLCKVHIKKSIEFRL